MKKTTEEHRQEVINYLTKTTQHTFIDPKSTYNWKESKYEYDYENGTYFKLVKNGDDFYILRNVGGKYTFRKLDHNDKIKYYEENAKCVLKHSLFLNKKMKSIRNTKFVQSEIDKIMETNLVIE